MERGPFIARLFAWLATIIIVVFLFIGGQWIFNTLAIPVMYFIFEMEGFIRAIEIIGFILFILFLIFLGRFLIEWITRLFNERKIAKWWAYIGSAICILFFAYVCFAPYFYTEQYLSKLGQERLHDIALLTSDELSKDERIKHAKKTLTMGEVRQESTEQSSFPLENIDIQSIEPIKVERSLNTYTYTVQVEQMTNHQTVPEVVTWIIDIKPGFFTFLVEGYERD